MTPAPTAAPRALPRLKAPTLIEEARPGASAAASITRICTGGTMAKAAAPQSSRPIAAPMGVVAISGIASMIAASAARKICVAPSSDQSASRPPSQLPKVKPTPISARPRVTKAGLAPARVSRIGAT